MKGLFIIWAISACVCVYGYSPEIPVCSNGCINGYCVAPERCLCYPDYEQDYTGSCTQRTQKCPHSCQNGHCANDECICDYGYKWDTESKTCKQKCKDDCGGLGTCIAPYTCSCRPGYQSTAEGSCEPDPRENSKPLCHSPCPHNSVCIGRNLCSSPTTSIESQDHHRPTNDRSQHSGNQVDAYYLQQQNGIYRDNHNYPQEQNHQYTDSHPNLYNPYGAQSQEFNNQRSNDQSQHGTNRRPQGSYDNRNQGERNHDDTQHPSYNYNQRLESSQQPYDSQRQYVDRNTQSTSTSGQFDTGYGRNRNDDSIQHHYGPSQHSYDSPSQREQHIDRRTQSTDSSSQYNTEIGRNQYSNQNTHSLPQLRPYDASRKETESANQENHNSQGSHGTDQGSYGTNQRPYFYYDSMSRTGENRGSTGDYNQYGQHGSSHYPEQSFRQQNVPVCSVYCINGHCVEGNRCSCNPGYIPDNTNPNVCQPECPEGCPNGVCSAPRLCLCNAGYYKDKSVHGQVCVKRTN